MPQVGHDDIKHGKKTSPGYFFFVTEGKPIKIRVCSGSHRFVNHPDYEKALLVEGLKPEKV